MRSTRVQRFLGLLHHFVLLAKLATSSIRVMVLETFALLFGGMRDSVAIVRLSRWLAGRMNGQSELADQTLSPYRHHGRLPGPLLHTAQHDTSDSFTSLIFHPLSTYSLESNQKY